MGKKRKASGRALDPERSEVNAEGDRKLTIKTWEDVADSEDEFHINRDRILLEEGSERKRQRRLQEEGINIFKRVVHCRLTVADTLCRSNI